MWLNEARRDLKNTKEKRHKYEMLLETPVGRSKMVHFVTSWRRSLLSNWHMILRHTRKCSFTWKVQRCLWQFSQNSQMPPARCAEFLYQDSPKSDNKCPQHDVQTFYTKIRPNRTTNMGNTDRNSVNFLSKATMSQSIFTKIQLWSTTFVKNVYKNFYENRWHYITGRWTDLRLYTRCSFFTSQIKPKMLYQHGLHSGGHVEGSPLH